ncbi:MAG TPA: YbaK/EbsC family protein [Terriglobales bacterium]|nr:YbaK/EbsC family protein [Terriglobales bacterium]
MRANRVKEFLDTNRIPYSSILHPTSYTAQGTAAYAHVPGKELAKTVIVRIDSQLAMVVLPASAQLDLGAIKRMSKARTVTLAGEPEFEFKFPDCDLGAMPPFGNLYGMPVYVDEFLTYDKEISFNAGSHNELVKMTYEDFERLVNPIVGHFAIAPVRTSA